MPDAFIERLVDREWRWTIWRSGSTSRLRVRVTEAIAVDETAILSLGLRGIARPSANRAHILIGPSARAG